MADNIVTRLATLIGWLELILAGMAAWIFAANVYYAVFSAGPEAEWAVHTAAVMLPAATLFGWAGWALVRRKSRAWQYQVVLVIVILLSFGLAPVGYLS